MSLGYVGVMKGVGGCRKLSQREIRDYMGGCQNDGPSWNTLNISCRIIIGIQKGTIILTTTHIGFGVRGCGYRFRLGLNQDCRAMLYHIWDQIAGLKDM